MSRTSIAVALASLLVLPPLAAQDPTPAAPAAPSVLFSAPETLTLRLTGPFRDLFRMRDRDSREWLDATLTHVSDAGDSTAFPVRISTRGRFRLQRQVCQFPPIRVDFGAEAVAGTLFQGQNRLKLVTHCQDRRDEYEQIGLQEHLIYRLYNLFTERSFRTRLARITYTDTGTGRDLVTKYAFFIEADEEMAARNGWELLESVAVVPPSQHDEETLIRLAVFQYLIGNTDWSAFQAPPGETQCCHNVRIIGSFAPPVFAVPYDFDWSGLINAPYARPNPILPIRSVRERLYRGICTSPERLDATLEEFRQRREAIYELIDGHEGLADRRRADTRKFVDDFYAIIGDPRQVERRIVRDCQKP